MLCSVKLNRQDTCLTYAMKRLGFEKLLTLGLNSVSNLDQFFDFSEYDGKILEKGTLVCWNLHQEEILIPNEISDDGSIHTNKLLINFHLGVVENSELQLVSDSTRKIEIGIPIVRVRSLNDIRKPDQILQLRKDFNF